MKLAFGEFDARLEALYRYLRSWGQVLRVDGQAKSGDKDVPDTIPHYLSIVPSSYLGVLQAAVEELDTTGRRITESMGRSRRPAEILTPRVVENAARVTVFENTQHASKRLPKSQLVTFLKEKLHHLGSNVQLEALIASIEGDPCRVWTMRHTAPCVGYKANIWHRDGRALKDVSIHRNGLILVGDDIHVSLPSDRPRKPRSDKLGEPALQWSNYGFYRLDSRDMVQAVIDHLEEAGDEKSAWI